MCKRSKIKHFFFKHNLLYQRTRGSVHRYHQSKQGSSHGNLPRTRGDRGVSDTQSFPTQKRRVSPPESFGRGAEDGGDSGIRRDAYLHLFCSLPIKAERNNHKGGSAGCAKRSRGKSTYANVKNRDT